ncbi:MAG: ABC transporter permease [Saprospiraceae bacterium]
MKSIIYFAYIVLALFTGSAILAYLITPDKSRFCNTQVLENAFLKPMSKACFKSSEDTIVTRTIKERINGSNDFQKLTLADSTDTQVKCRYYMLGTDRYGRDLLSRLIIGIRYTLLVALLSVIFAMTIGVFFGAIAGYYGGKTDKIISFIIGIFWALPTILLAFVILMTFGRNISSLFLSIGITIWADIARLVRGLVISIKQQYFVQASRAMGYSDHRIIVSQILPNIGGPLLVQCSSNFAMAVLLESGLSFMGLGLQAPIPTLGNILQDQYTQAFNGQILQSLIPAIVLVLLILSFQIIANHLRDKLDVKLIKK